MLKTTVQGLRATLLRTLPACEGRTTIPILSMARLTAEAGVLTVSTTNLDNQLEVDSLVEVSRETQIAINPRQALGLLRFLPRTDAIEIATEAEAVFLCWAGGKARISSLTACDFPDLAVSGDPVAGRIGEADYAALRRISPFISSEETRYYLNGVCLDVIDGQAVAVATDGHHLGAMPLSDELAPVLKLIRKPIIPRDAVRILLGQNAGAADFTFYRANKSSPIFEVRGDAMRLRSKLIDGDYPNWQRILPKDVKISIEVARTDLLCACNIARAFAPHRNNDVCLVAEKGRMQLQAKHYDAELAIDLGSQPANVYWELPINVGYLTAAISAVRGASVILSAEHDKGAVAVAGSDQAPGEHVMAMPLRYGGRTSFSAPMQEAA